MKKLALVSLLAPVLIVAGCGTVANNATPSSSSANTTSTAATSNANVPLLAVVSPALEGPCTVSDQYKAGDHVIFRIQIIDPTTGKSMSDQDLQGVSIVLPNNQTVAANYGTHEGGTQKFWVAHWTVPSNYPTGQVKYTVKVTGSSRSVERLQFAVPDKGAHLTIVS